MDRQELAGRIHGLSERNLRVVESVLRALDDMKENKYPFLGNFLHVERDASEDPEEFVCSMPIVPEILNPYRIVYGGITATLADMAMAWMLEHRIANRDKFVTIDMNVNYHSPGTGKRLIARSRFTHQARDILQTSCTIANDKNDLVATASATFLQLVKKGN